MILLIDNYDSFTYNLYQYMGIFEKDIKVVRNDKITIEEIEQLNPNRIVLSPGPKSPKEAGICMDVVKHFYTKKPILGICLGIRASELHLEQNHSCKRTDAWKTVVNRTRWKERFWGIPSPVHVARYHSLAVDEKTLPDVFEILARTEDGEIMAMQHKEYPLIGISSIQNLFIQIMEKR